MNGEKMAKINPSPITHSPSTAVHTPAIAVIGSGYWGKNLVRNFYNLNSLKLVSDKMKQFYLFSKISTMASIPV